MRARRRPANAGGALVTAAGATADGHRVAQELDGPLLFGAPGDHVAKPGPPFPEAKSANAWLAMGGTTRTPAKRRRPRSTRNEPSGAEASLRRDEHRLLAAGPDDLRRGASR